MYVNKCTKCGAEFETKNPKRVICPNCLYSDKKTSSESPEGAEGQEKEKPAPSSFSTSYSSESFQGRDDRPRFDGPRNYNQPQRPYNNNPRPFNGGGQRYDNNRGGYDRPQRPYDRNNEGYQRPQQGGYQQGGYQRPQQGGYQRPQQGGYQQGGYQRPQQGGFQQGGYQRPQQGGYQQGGYQRPQQGGFQRPGGYQQGGFQRPQGGGFGGQRPGGFRPGGARPPQRPAKQLLVDREQLVQIEELYKKMLPLPNPDAHEVIGEQIELEARKVFFGINLIRQKMMLPKLPYPKRKLAVSPDQLMAIKALYEPLLPLPPIGCHKIISAQLKIDEWRVHVGIGLVRKQMGLDRWNPDRKDAPKEFKKKTVKKAEKAPASKAESETSDAEAVVEPKPKRATRAKAKPAEETPEIESTDNE